MQKLNIMITSPLDKKDIERIEQMGPGIHVDYAMEEVVAELGIKWANPFGQPIKADMAAEDGTKRLDKMLADTDIILAWRLPKNLMARAPKLKWVQAIAAGVDMVAGTSGLLESDVTLTNFAGVAADAISEWGMFMMLTLAKDGRGLLKSQADHRWSNYTPMELKNKTVCVVGLGNVGRQVVKRVRSFGMRVLAAEKMVSKHESNVGDVHELYPSSMLPEILPECDWVVLTLPLTSETRGLIGEKELKSMKPTAHLINIARGPLVNQDALITALKKGWIAGAGLDVFEKEPLPKENELWDMKNVILSSHNAGLLEKHSEEIADIFCENLKHFMAGEELIKLVDKSQLI